MSLLMSLFLSRIRLPRDIHRFAFRKYSDRVAVQFEGDSVTYRQLQDRSYRLVQAWQGMGLKQGDVVFAQVDTGEEFFVIRTATLEMGIVLTSFHALHTPEFVVHAASQANPKLCIVDEAFVAGSADALKGANPDLPVWGIGSASAFEQAIATHDPRPSKQKIRPEDAMVLGFTSGTTGPPKGLISSHGAAIASLKLLMRKLNIKPDKSVVHINMSTIPLVGAGSGLIFPTLLSGGILVVMKDYSPTKMVEMVKQHSVTRLFVTPSQLIDLLEMPQSVDADLATVTQIIYGTAPMPAAKLQEAILRFGPIFQQGYGQAEVLPPVSLLSPAEHMQDGKPAPRTVLMSCGKVVDGVLVRISGPNEQPLPVGEIGEIHVNTPTRFQTYLNPAQNKGVILDGGFFNTGDHGFIDPDGYLHVIDREADIINTPDGALYPRLIEEEAHDHPAVRECCFVETGKGPVLFVSLRNSFCDANRDDVASEIKDLLKQRLPQWQVPKDVAVIDTIPRSFLGKVLRRNVREEMTHDTSN